MLGEHVDYPRCPKCGVKTDRYWIDPGFVLRKRGFDASYTYDGYLIVTERLRSLLEKGTARFLTLPSEPGFHVLVAEEVVPFDSGRRQTRFEQWCDLCERYAVVAGATPAFLDVSRPLPGWVYRTDIEFGSGNEQHPLTVVGPGTADRIRLGGFAGIDLLPVEGAGGGSRRYAEP
jgi:hypothetical protein